MTIHRAAAAVLREKGVVLRELEDDEPLSAGSLPATAGDPDRAGCCLFTSGSTGTPKGVLVSAGDLEARAMAEARLFGLGPGEVLLSILPFSFDVGLNQLLSALTVGCTLVLLDSWLPADILKAVATTRVTGISAVPSIWQDMLHAGMRFDTDGAHRSLRYITISGGDLLPQQLERVAHLAPGCSVFKTYGQTETFRSTALRPEEFTVKRESVGRALENVRVYVLRDDGTPCSPHEVGEVVHTGLGTMTGYLDGEDPQRKLRPNPFFGEGDRRRFAVFTGDLGFLDEDGHLYLKGRRDAMLKVEGNRVYPQEIAKHIVGLEAVQEAEVVGIRDDGGRTMLVGFVVLARGVSTSARELRRALIDRLPSYMVPSHVVALEAIPRTASGKPDVPELQDRARRLPKQSAAKT
jgi:acyl-coenzyme A synthetase/AMP-(fatty) acid ligase